MAVAITVRLDDEALRALRQLEASGLSRSEAIRRPILDSAARMRRQALANDVAALQADEADRQEMLEVAALMESLRAPGDIHEIRMPHGKVTSLAGVGSKLPTSFTRRPAIATSADCDIRCKDQAAPRRGRSGDHHSVRWHDQPAQPAMAGRR
jgi:hypothetical protein